MRYSIFLMWLSAALLVAAKDKAPADGLSPKLHEVIENVETAYRGGDIEGVWRLLAKPMNGLSESLAAKFDDALAAKKLPPARELLVQARLKVLLEERAAALPAPSPKERFLILAALADHVQNPLAEIAGGPLLQPDLPAPRNMDEFDRRLHQIHEVAVKLWLARTCAAYAGDLAGKFSAASRKKLSDKEQALIAGSEGDLLKDVRDAEMDVRELELETRLLRLRYGVEVLRKKDLTKEKFIAAATTRQDVRALQQAIVPPAPVLPKGAKAAAAANSPAPVVFQRAALAGPDLGNDVATLGRRAADAAGPLGDKAERFFAGLEFWLRGRYGWGPDVGGLAKSNAALQQPQLLHQVYMPDNLLTLADEETESPKPPASGRRPETPPRIAKKGKATPTCPDRRHHYTWAWEDRRLVSSTNRQTVDHEVQAKVYAVWIDNSGQGHSILDLMRPPHGNYIYYGKGFSNTERAWGPEHYATYETQSSVRVPPQDPRLVYRIVGFVEYASAVQHLDKFVEEATIGEFEAAEEIIRSQDAFRFQTNLSRNVEGQSTLSEQTPNPRDDFNRHGLEWMLALARVELGAMLAGFTSHAEPFLSMAPTTYRQERVKTVPFGMAAYGELLMDGLRSHYWSIVREELVPNFYKSGVPENHLLTYGRRALIGRQFVRAVLRVGGGGNAGENLPVPQRTELESWDQMFVKLQRIALYCLTFKVDRSKLTVTEGLSIAGISSSLNVQRDQTPDAIRRILLLADP
ncbi:MAG TPA: hypothetical protein VGH74_00250, partial [Planctomycetaceae bacterium]